MRIRSISATPLSVPLREPFVIASGRIDATRAALVELTLEGPHGAEIGLGEAAALPPVTREDQPDLLATLAAVEARLCGRELSALADIAGVLDAELADRPVARAGVECALLDAWARLEQVPLCTLLRGTSPRRLVTDITLPIAEPSHMASLAVEYRRQGFRIFKVKVGKDLDADVRALAGVRARVPDAIFRLDANEGFSAAQALELLAAAHGVGASVECFEQPCARADWDGMSRVTREAGVSVIADESVRDDADLTQLIALGAAHGVNLKLAKSGGLLRALAIGERARAHGLRVMCGGMVETRLGMTAMAHVACALDAVEYIDLDTAFLLAEERFAGGYTANGPELDVGPGAGLAVSHAPPRAAVTGLSD